MTFQSTRALAQAPTITNFTPTTGSVGTLVRITGTNLSNPTAITIGGVAAIPISNDGTTLVTMVMPGATTGALSIATSAGTGNGTGNFTVTPTQAPNTQQGNKLVGTGTIGSAEQGFSVSISADGNTAIVGGFRDNSNVGAAWVYTRSGSTWSQQGNKLVGTGAVGAAQQGFSVSISADGNTAIVGGRNDNSNVGAAWIYTRSGSTWSQQGSKLVGTGAVGAAQQGFSVSISADGNTAIVGGRNDNSSVGAAWIYTRSGGIWTQQGNKLVGTGANGLAQQGSSVSISADGNTAIVGGPADDFFIIGAAWVYTRNGSTWTQQGNKLVGTGVSGSSASQGSSVSISADGNTAIVGGDLDDEGVGAAWIYTRSGNLWTQQGNKLVGTGATGAASQGSSVSISADGNTAIVGGLGDGSGGAAWVYTRSGGVWTQKGNKLVGTGAVFGAQQGNSVSISADGNNAIVGGNVDNIFTGAAWIYNYVPQPPIITNFTPTMGSVGTLVSINGTDLNNTTAVTIGGASAIPISNNGTTLVALVMPGATTGGISITTDGGTANGISNFTITPTQAPNTQQGNKLVGTGAVGSAVQGNSVSVSADGNTAIVGGYNDNGALGAAWIYTRNGNIWTQQGGKLVGTGATGVARQGWSVSISADGNTAIVGGYTDNSSIGAAWVYTRTGSTWTQQGNKLVSSDAIGASQQGYSVSISADGNTAIVGGIGDNSNAGAAWIYTRNGGIWTQQGNKLVGTGATGAAQQGFSVSISSDGNNAIVGGVADNSNAGAVWIYTRNGTTWTQQGNKLVGTGSIGAARQGRSVSISADGSTAIVGGNEDNNFTGAAWVYTRSGGTWTQQGNKLVGSGSTGAARQGRSVSISGDGNTAIVGGDTDESNAGAAWLFTRNGSTWTQLGNKLLGTGATGAARQGWSVSISADGNTTLVSGNSDNVNRGAVWVYNYVAPPPTITSFTPLSAKPGDIVTITGTGFNTNTASNIVFFGATKATVTAATATSITVTVPTGATFAPITVLNTTSQLVAYSMQSFNPIYSPVKTAITANDFIPKVDLETGVSPLSVAIGDLDGDGKADLVVANENSSTISIFRNTSTNGSLTLGSFSGKVDIATGSSPYFVAIGDLDGDGKPDLAVANRSSTTVSIFRNTSTIGSITAGSFAAKVDFTTGSTPTSLALGDLDGDGRTDIGVANYSSNSVSILRNIGNSGSITESSFAAKVDFTTSGFPNSIAIGDLDGDGKSDLAVTNESPSSVSIFRNTSVIGSIDIGSFANAFDISYGAVPTLLAIGDLDRDGKSDLLVANGTSSVSVFRNTSSNGIIDANSFAANVDFTTTGTATSVAIGDLDGDNKPDFAVANANAGSTSVSVFRNTSTSGSITSGSFAPKIDFTTAFSPRSVAIGDLDGDSKPDLVTANIGLSNISIIRNASNTPDLSALTLSSGTLSPAFVASTTAYTASVSNLITSITVTPTVADANATVTVNGISVTSGNASGAITLNVGSNTITTLVTAQNGTTKIYTVIITRAVNNAPTDIALTPTSINENVPANSIVGSLTSTDPDVGNTFTYTLVAGTGGDNNASFSVSGDELRINNSPNFETTPSFSVRIRTTDQGGLTREQAFTITVNNVNESPTIANAIPNQNATEDQLFNFTFAANTFADVDAGTTLTYTSQLNGGGALPTWLSFDGATRTFSGTPLNTNIGTIIIDVIANDGSGGTITAIFNIVVGATLPVTLNQYSAKLQTNGTVLLTWDTFAEQSNDYFEISKSTDGENFVLLSTIKGNETTTRRSLYNYTDRTPKSGDNYYKLVQVDLDGAREELGIRSAKVALANDSKVTIYPNPSTDLVNIVFEAGKFISIELIDLNGRLIQKKEVLSKALETTLEVKDLPSSSYLIKLVGNQETITRILIVKK
nr:FG-GAP-like repeat-containing protein [Pedobacter glucosidilyticus]